MKNSVNHDSVVFNIKKTEIVATGPLGPRQIDEGEVDVAFYLPEFRRSHQMMVTAVMESKDGCFWEETL